MTKHSRTTGRNFLLTWENRKSCLEIIELSPFSVVLRRLRENVERAVPSGLASDT